jgi:hypothetical protein
MLATLSTSYRCWPASRKPKSPSGKRSTKVPTETTTAICAARTYSSEMSTTSGSR